MLYRVPMTPRRALKAIPVLLHSPAALERSRSAAEERFDRTRSRSEGDAYRCGQPLSDLCEATVAFGFGSTYRIDQGQLPPQACEAGVTRLVRRWADNPRPFNSRE